MGRTAKEWVRSVLSGIITGLIAGIIIVLAGQSSPLTLLVSMLATFLVVTVLFEVLQQEWLWQAMPFELASPVKWRHADVVVKPLPQLAEGGWLDYELAVMTAFSTVIRLLDRLTKETGKNTERTTAHTQRIVAAQNAPIARRHRVATETAKDFEGYASRLDRFEEDYGNATRQITENYLNLLETAPKGTPWAVLSEGLGRLVESTKSASVSTAAQRASAVDLRKARISQALNQAMDHQIATLTKIIKDMDAFAASCEKVITQIAAKFPLAEEPPKP